MENTGWTWLLVLVGVMVLWSHAQDSEMVGRGPYDWYSYDSFDEVSDRMDAVTWENCKSKPAEELYLPESVVTQLPRFNRLLSSIIYPNRTKLLHLHNMALNRAFFYSYMYQKLNESWQFPYQPGLMYYYFSTAADVSANEYNINGSAIIFDSNGTYPNWYRNLAFNETLNLFGARAYRLDDYNDPTNWLREPTNHTIDILDYGAGPQSNYTHKSYKINEWFEAWLPDGWEKQGQDSVRKHSYDVGIKYSNETGKFTDDEFDVKTFFGPPSPGQNEVDYLPVVYTKPYYDCGRSNKWIVSAVSPVVDQLPRYLKWFHLRRFRFVAVSVQDIDFLSIDFNPCPASIGNQLPNYLVDTARCKQTTMCEPLHGWGFRRGGYRCVCKPGYRLPPWQRGPFMGADIESATEEEYKNGFDCFPVELRLVLPVIRGNETGTPTYSFTSTRRKRKVRSGQQTEEEDPLFDYAYKPEWQKGMRPAIKELKEPLQSRILRKQQRLLRELGLEEAPDVENPGKVKIVARKHYHKQQAEREEERKSKLKLNPRYKRDTAKSRQKRYTQYYNADDYSRQAFDQAAYDRMQVIRAHKESVNKDNCHTYKPEDLELPGDVSYGVETQFSPQASTALRLSHFLSNFLQNIDRYEEYGNLRGDNLLNVDQLFGEVVANVMGDLKIKGSGVFWDVDKFESWDGKTRQFFGPYAYRYEEDTEGGPVGDRANTQFRAVDFAGYPTHYLDDPWFKNVKERWQSNTYGLTKFTEKPMIRSDLEGTSLKRFEMYPMYYEAPNLEDGWWSAPYFSCTNEHSVKDWVITYSVPFFGLNSIRAALEFKGVVTVDVKLDELDIQQCPADYYVPNAFKSTARCHFESTYCENLPGLKWGGKGAYKCECLQGYEYPFNDRAWYFDGQTMEEEYRKMMLNQAHRFHTLKCRLAGASAARSSWVLIAILSAVYFYTSQL